MELVRLIVALLVGGVAGAVLWPRIWYWLLVGRKAGAASAAELAIEELHYDKDGLTVAMRHEAVLGMANILAGFFKDRGGPNYVEMQLISDDLGPLVLTLRPSHGFTPHEMRQQAERACAAVLNELTRLCVERNIQESPDVLWATMMLEAAGYERDVLGYVTPKAK